MRKRLRMVIGQRRQKWGHKNSSQGYFWGTGTGATRILRRTSGYWSQGVGEPFENCSFTDLLIILSYPVGRSASEELSLHWPLYQINQKLSQTPDYNNHYPVEPVHPKKTRVAIFKFLTAPKFFFWRRKPALKIIEKRSFLWHSWQLLTELQLFAQKFLPGIKRM